MRMKAEKHDPLRSRFLHALCLILALQKHHVFMYITSSCGQRATLRTLRGAFFLSIYALEATKAKALKGNCVL